MTSGEIGVNAAKPKVNGANGFGQNIGFLLFQQHFPS